jgi:hypothetical protein
VTRFSYCTETIIQAGNKGLAIGSVQIYTNPKLRESRLFNSSWEMITKTGMIIVRAYIMYKPYVLFGSLAWLLFLIGLIPFSRFFIASITDGSTRGHIQSLLIGGFLMTTAFLCVALNVIADLIRINRILIEDTLELAKRQRYQS